MQINYYLLNFLLGQATLKLNRIMPYTEKELEEISLWQTKLIKTNIEKAIKDLREDLDQIKKALESKCDHPNITEDSIDTVITQTCQDCGRAEQIFR